MNNEEKVTVEEIARAGHSYDIALGDVEKTKVALETAQRQLNQKIAEHAAAEKKLADTEAQIRKLAKSL